MHHTLRRPIAVALCVAALTTAPSSAQPLSPEHVPAELVPWIPWVLDEAPDARCPAVGEHRVCVWPSALAIDVVGNAARFTLRVSVERAGTVALPGSAEHWPIDVELAAKRVPVLEHDGRPTLELAPGTHTVTGRFVFAEAPAALQVPANVGALSVRRNGAELLRPRREPNGLVWIDERARDASEQQLTLSVHRRIEDAVPLRVITRLELTASGPPREVSFDAVVLAGTRPVELRAGVPVQLSPTGKLRVQAEAGTYRIEIVAISELPLRELRAPQALAPWPDHEVWVFQADEQLRHVVLRGPPQVDAGRTDLGRDWHGLPTFMLASGKALSLETRRRGQPEPGANRLALERSLWLDLDGDGYTVRDQLRGTMQRQFRLDLHAGRLGRAVVDGVDALITRHGPQSGIELRRGDVDVVTEWRLERGRHELPAVGYSEDVDTLSATLHLPPGFMLLGARGVDLARNSWLDSWDLFDFFFVLLLGLAVAKLAGRGLGLVTVLALTLTQHEPEAPAFTWVALLAATALTRALAQGRWAKLARGAWLLALVALLVVFVPFAIERTRSALYPQLAAPPGAEEWAASEGETSASAAEEAAPRPAAASKTRAPAAPEDADLAGSLSIARIGYGGDDSARGGGGAPLAQSFAARELIDPNAVVQTGPGVPSWRFAQHALHWSGPVERSERVRLWLLPPPGTRLWSFSSVVLSGLLLFALARAMPAAPGPPGGAQTTSEQGPSTAAAMLALFIGFLAPASVLAQAPPPPDPSFPPSVLLDQLRERLLRPPACAPHCLAVPLLSLSLGERRLDLRAQLHAGAGAIYRAPGPLEQWPIDRVRLDGQDAFAAVRLADGFLHIRVPPGIHTLELGGPLAGEQASTLALGAPAPHRVEASGRGWSVEGLHADGTSDGSIELRRIAPSANGAHAAQALTPWLELRRELELGLRFRLLTTITRLGPAGDSAVVRVRLLEGESVTEAGLVSEGDSVVVTLAREQRTFSFSSTLAPRPVLELEAAQPSERGVLVRPYTELWVVRPSALYRTRFEGIPPVSQLGQGQRLEPTYRPWPGERLRVHAERLEPAEGASVTIDRAELRLAPGTRIEDSTLLLAVRASRGASEHITLPPGATLASLEIDGRPHPARLERGVLELPLDPGSHSVVIRSKRAAGLGFRYAPATPALARPLTNVQASISVPPDRWLLATGGPAWGPAVLFWGHLIAIVLAAFALGRVALSPLRGYQWALLGLGLTQVEAPVALIVVGWFFALAYRERHIAEHRRLFNFVQITLVLFTLVALSCLAYAVHKGLLVPPEMQVQGMLSNHNFVQWYTDRTPGAFPDLTLYSAPLWIYKTIMLLWALWLAVGLIHWLRWGWTAFRKGGGFRPKPRGGPKGSASLPAPHESPGSANASSERAERERARVS